MPEQEPDPIQQKLIEARRNQILDAATRVFAEKGFSRATIRDVAAVAGIADGTIYNYFTNKNALLLGLLHRMNETAERRRQFQDAEDMSVEAFVDSYVRHRLATVTSGGLQLFQVLMSEVLINPEIRQEYYRDAVAPTFAIAEQQFATWVEKGEIAAIDPKLAPRVFAGMIVGLMMLRVMGDTQLEEQWDRVPDLLGALLLHGLSPQP